MDTSEMNDEIKCPVCGEGNNHPVKITVKNFKRNNTIEVIDTGFFMRQSEPEGRGIIIKILYDCEHGHSFIIEQQFHKGATYIRSYEVEKTILGTIWRD